MRSPVTVRRTIAGHGSAHAARGILAKDGDGKGREGRGPSTAVASTGPSSSSSTVSRAVVAAGTVGGPSVAEPGVRTGAPTKVGRYGDGVSGVSKEGRPPSSVRLRPTATPSSYGVSAYGEPRTGVRKGARTLGRACTSWEDPGGG